MIKKITLLVFILAFYFRAVSQTGIDVTSMHSVDNLVKSFMTTWGIGGGEVAITKDGKLIYNRGFGFADQAKTQITQPYNLFRIASVSKPITSIAIMKLIESGKLSINDTVFGANKILNQNYYLSSITDSRIYSITIKNLLEHNAGWDRDIACDGYPSCDPIGFPLHVTNVLGAPNPVGDSTLIKFLLQKGLNHNPGSTYAYSNIGYLILGKVIEKISKLKYEDYVKTNIFDPLGLCDIHLGKNLLADKQEREVEYNNTYTTLSCYGNGQTVPWQYGGWNLEAMNAHGGWIATASDLTKLILAVDNYSTFPDILSSATISTMTSPSSTNSTYAKGWAVNSSGNWWHTGSLDGTATFIARTSGGYTWAILLNSRGDNSANFYNALDALPWNCIASVSTFPSHNLFPPTGNIGAIAIYYIDQTSVSVVVNNFNGDGRIIAMTESSSPMAFPEDGISYTANTSFGNGSKIGNNTYVVYSGTGNSVTITNLDPTKVYRVTGFDYLKNTTTNNQVIYKTGCGVTAGFATHPNGIGFKNKNSKIGIFPNPTNGMVKLVSDFYFTDAMIQITDIRGVVVLEQKNLSGYEVNLNISEYANGIYFLEMKDGNVISRIKVIKNQARN